MLNAILDRLVRRPLHWDVAALAHQPALLRVDSQSVRIAVLLALMALLNLVDLRFTLFAHEVGMLGEVNPIAANFLSQGLEPSLVCFKVLSMLVATATFWRARKSPWTPRACWALVGVYVGLSITWLMWAHTFNDMEYSRLLLSIAHR